MTKFRRNVLLAALLVAFGYILYVPGRILWEPYALRHVCAALRPGTPIADVRPLLKRYGFYNPLVEYEGEGSFNEQTQEWELAIPALLTYGDYECLIRHNRNVVLGTTLLLPPDV